MAPTPDDAAPASDDETTAGPLRDGAPSASKAMDDAEIGGPSGPEPTRYGDWERKGRCIDF
jgi:hypothetical protein